MDKCSLVTYVGLVGWIVTIIGWFVNSTLSNDRETRKEKRSEIDKLTDDLDKLLKSSHAYYCSHDQVEQKIAQSEISSLFNKLSGSVERLEKSNSDLKLQKKLDALYEAITGGDYGSSKVDRTPSLYVEKSERIAILSEDLRSISEEWFCKTFQ